MYTITVLCRTMFCWAEHGTDLPREEDELSCCSPTFLHSFFSAGGFLQFLWRISAADHDSFLNHFFNFCCSQNFFLVSSQKEYSAKLGRQSSVLCSDFPFWNQCHTSVNFKSCHFSCNLGVDGAENLAYMGEMSPTDLGLNKTGEGTLTHTFLCSSCQFSLTFTGNPPSLLSRLTSVIMSIVKIVCDKPCIKSSKYVRIALNVNCEL